MSPQTTLTEKITFEQPLNDPLRICLRIEHLKTQFDSSLQIQTKTGSRIAITSLLKLLNVIDRPDIKSKLVQTLSAHASTLAQLEQFPQVDTDRLKKILNQLDDMINLLHRHHGKIGHKLRENEFLNQIRLQLNNPAGACKDRVPAYAAWLAKPVQERMNDLTNWANEFDFILEIAAMVLNITRNSTSPQLIYATTGFYQQALDPSLPIQLIQVILPADINVYPEISVGRHRLNIRFMTPIYHGAGRANQSNSNFNFELNCCR